MKQMNLVELYNYIKENGEATVKTLGYSGVIYDTDLDFFLQNNFKLVAVFEVYDKADNEEPFEITGWIEKEGTLTKDVVIFGEVISVPIDWQTYAVDEDGYLFAYRVENPKLTDYEWRSVDNIYLGTVNYKGDWKKSLTKI